jgi:hypothetical protein
MDFTSPFSFIVYSLDNPDTRLLCLNCGTELISKKDEEGKRKTLPHACWKDQAYCNNCAKDMPQLAGLYAPVIS